MKSQADVDPPSVMQYIISDIQDEPVNKTILYRAKIICEFKERFVQHEVIRKEEMSKAKSLKQEGKKKTIQDVVIPIKTKRC